MIKKRKPEDCPTCNGWVLINGNWVKFRETAGMVCQTCKKDYSITKEK